MIITATYNEKGNVIKLLSCIFEQGLNLPVRVIDDNSPDGTGKILDKLKEKYPLLQVVHRPRKLGLGTAYLGVFKEIIKDSSVDFVITMDADLSHDPQVLPKIVKNLKEGYDLVVGSRYVRGGGVVNWPFSRRLLSRGGSLYAGLITGAPIRDLTGGFNGYSKRILKNLDLDNIMSGGYSFFIEMKFRCWKAKAKYCEVPIIFKERERGVSKLSSGIFWEGLKIPWQLRFGNK